MTRYGIECDGCGEEVLVEVNGYIADFGEAWCESCGYLGRNTPVVEKKPFFSLAQVKAIFANMPEGHELKGVLATVLDSIERWPENSHAYLVSANSMIPRNFLRFAELEGEEE